MAKKLVHLTVSFFLVAMVAQTASWADKGRQHQERQDRPIQLGTSGGSIDHLDGAYCCGGTLGALVQDADGIKYILGNNHVMARVDRGVAAEDIIQPGLIDLECQQYQDDIVADLTRYVPIEVDFTNRADAAIAQVRDGQVDPEGSILDIGLISSNTVSAFAGQKVKKSGRTTGLTSGAVQAIDVSVNVQYPLECGGSSYKVANFVEQILIGPRRFSAAGDSGSLVVEGSEVDPTDGLPRAVGLLFAGSSSYTLANPIDAVLAELGGLVMVAGTAPEPPPGGEGEPVGTIAGTVTSSAGGTALAGAKVAVLETRQSTKTDASGSYSIANVPIGTGYSVKTSAKWFASQTVTDIKVQQDQTTVVDFLLVPRVSMDAHSATAAGHARKVKGRHSKAIFAMPGVVGHGVGRSDGGKPTIEIYLDQETAAARAQIPPLLDDVPVRVLVTGPFVAF